VSILSIFIDGAKHWIPAKMVSLVKRIGRGLLWGFAKFARNQSEEKNSDHGARNLFVQCQTSYLN
jgi:hypothetical protein